MFKHDNILPWWFEQISIIKIKLTHFLQINKILLVQNNFSRQN